MGYYTTANGERVIRGGTAADPGWASFAKKDGAWTLYLYDVTYRLLHHPDGSWNLYSENADGIDFAGEVGGETLPAAVDAALDAILRRNLRGIGHIA